MAHYSAGILICLCLYFICGAVVASEENDARNGYKGRYGRQPSHYEIIIPHRVTRTGKFISHMIPRHYKRDYYKNRRQEDMGPEDMVHYMIPIAGEKHHLQLLPSSSKMLSPGAVVEVHDDRDISQREIRRLGNNQCHYTGSVMGQVDSRAALSTCYGLSGYIRTKRGYFIIEPASGHNPLSGNEHPHLLYQHDEDPPVMETNCVTTGNLAKILATRATAYEYEEAIEEQERNKNNPQKEGITEFHVEAMVVLDRTLLNFHKELDVENYVLTVFNMAHHLYHDVSLGININLAIVRMIRLEEEEHKLNLAVSKDARKTLEFFRDWQYKMNAGDDTHPNHHDVAVLLTRVNICSSDDNCGILGASILAGMCEPKQQAVLCEDNGLRLGFVIAHEIAHTLAIPHDTPSESGCEATLPNNLYTVMNPSVNIQTAEWSTCSSKFLELFMEQELGKCLYDEPIDHSFEMPDILPGVMYGGDYQCRELLGPNAALCDTGMECQNLICYVEDRGCVETHTFPAQGTSCGERKWCFNGKCLQVGQRPGAVDGKWGCWSTWSECSRTCGSGVSKRERHCDTPAPAHGGRDCVGESKSHRICNTEPCALGKPSFRNVQCAAFNEWIYPEDNIRHEWKAYHMEDENPCILFCINDEGEIASLRPRVIDGTKCLRGLRDICIDGTCREIPCDLDLESNVVEDWCGVCRGDGTSCKGFAGEQFVQEGFIADSKVKLVDIPKGTVNIKIEEAEPSEAKIEVGCRDGKVMYLRDGMAGVYNLSGTKAWLGNIRTKQEALIIPGPTTRELSIWIATLDNVTIKYSFGLKERQKRCPHFKWNYVDWSKCSSYCGPGIQISTPRCIEQLAGVVDNSYCKNAKRPKEQMRPCEIAPCISRWLIGDWQDCLCPRGVRYRIVKCIKPTGEGEGESDIISDRECAGQKPRQKESCSCRNIALRHAAWRRKGVKKPKKILKSRDSCKRSLCLDFTVDKNDPREENQEQKANTVRVPIQSIVVDKENVSGVRLTLHRESDEDKRSQPAELVGKAALEFLTQSRKDFRNNKTRI